jgi:hypothetical protein
MMTASEPHPSPCEQYRPTTGRGGSRRDVWRFCCHHRRLQQCSGFIILRHCASHGNCSPSLPLPSSLSCKTLPLSSSSLSSHQNANPGSQNLSKGGNWRQSTRVDHHHCRCIEDNPRQSPPIRGPLGGIGSLICNMRDALLKSCV